MRSTVSGFLAGSLLGLLLFASVATVYAVHRLEYPNPVDEWPTNNGVTDYIHYRVGYNWLHPDDNHWYGAVYMSGNPGSGDGIWDSLWQSQWAGSSCDNGASYPWWSSASRSTTNTNALGGFTDGAIFIPTCQSNPKYRTQGSFQWTDYNQWSRNHSHQG